MATLHFSGIVRPQVSVEDRWQLVAPAPTDHRRLPSPFQSIFYGVGMSSGSGNSVGHGHVQYRSCIDSLTVQGMRDEDLRLAEALGKFARQLLRGDQRVTEVTVTFKSGRMQGEFDRHLMRGMIRKGLGVNLECVVKCFEDHTVSSPTTLAISIPYVEPLFKSALGNNGQLVLEGVVKAGHPFLSKIGTFDNIDQVMEGKIILYRPVDLVREFGSTLCQEEGVLVHSMTKGLSGFGDSIVVMGCGKWPLEQSTLAKLHAIPAVKEMICISFQ